MRRAWTLAAIAAVAALGAGAVEASAAGLSASPAKVKVTLIDFKLTPSVKRVAAGKVTFVVPNAGSSLGAAIGFPGGRGICVLTPGVELEALPKYVP